MCVCGCGCVCMSVNDTFCVCVVCCEACVCACDSVLLVPCLWGEGGELICQCVCLCYIVLKNSITGQKQCNSFHLCSKG